MKTKTSNHMTWKISNETIRYDKKENAGRQAGELSQARRLL